MTYLLDTKSVSELRRASKADPQVLVWAKRQDPANLFLSAISILEIELGALLVERKDQAQGALLLDWLNNQVLPGFGSRILPIDVAVARRCARLHVPDPRADRDALIAATALVHGFTVVTRNVRDFEPTAVPTLNPWTAAT